MSEAVDPQRPVRPRIDLGLAYAVFDAFQRISEGGIDEPVRIGQHVGDAAAAHILCIERQDHGRKQYTAALPFDGSTRGLRRAPGFRDDALGLLGDELLVGFGAIGRESVRFLRPQFLQLLLLDDPERRAHGQRVQRHTVGHDGPSARGILNKRMIE